MPLLHSSSFSSSGSSFVFFFLPLILIVLLSSAAFCPPARHHHTIITATNHHHHHHHRHINIIPTPSPNCVIIATTTTIPLAMSSASASSSTEAQAAAQAATPLGNIIDGKAIADTIRAELAQSLSESLSSAPTNATTTNCKPGLAVMLVGNRTDSQTYVRMKQKACADCGMVSFLREFKDDTSTITEETLLQTIHDWNNDDTIHGILIQLPLPPNINEAKILSAVLPSKDVDGLHPANVACLFNTATHNTNHVDNDNAETIKLNWKNFESIPFHIPCTPQGCIELLDRSSISIEGKHAVVIGRSNLVGLPVAMLLLHRNATVTIVHSRTTNIESMVRSADIVVAAVGRANMVKSSWLKTGCAVIDVGINSVDDPTSKRGYKLVGDVDYDMAKEVAGWITPVPGGVGPMTIAMLLRNTLNSWRRATAAAAAAAAIRDNE